MAIGISKKLLVKISTCKLEVHPSIIKKEIQLGQKREKQYENYEFNRYWNKRYELFSNFDEGIKIDEESWANTPPEPVSEYIASKCAGGKVFLDVFGNVGGTSIKLASLSSCIKVVALESNSQKLKFLINNAKIYEMDRLIEIFEANFLNYSEKRTFDVVFLNPVRPDHVNEFRSMGLQEFQPSLDKLIYKSLKLSNNMILLLPPNISLESLCSCINKCCTEMKKTKETCSIKIEKIIFRGELKYILLLFGPFVQNEIKLND